MVDVVEEYKKVYFAGAEINALVLDSESVGERIVDQAIYKGLDVDVFGGTSIDNYMIVNAGLDIMGCTDRYIFILEYDHERSASYHVLFGTNNDNYVESLVSSLLEKE